MKRSLCITSHAITRYQQRVRPDASRLEATAELRQIATHAKSRSRLRWWTQVAGERPGCRYLYWAMRPEVCLVVQGDAVVTVFSRSVCAAWRARSWGDMPPITVLSFDTPGVSHGEAA